MQRRAQLRIYYAHPICIYGWPVERREMAAIRRRFTRCRIVNPATYRHHPDKLRDQIGFCLRLVARSHAVVFSRLLGEVTAGVGEGENTALRLGKPV